MKKKNKTLNYSVNKNIISPRDNFKVKNKSKYRLGSGIMKKKYL